MTTATFTSNLGAFVKDHHEAIDVALKEAAKKYQSAVETRLAMGYKAGTFKTGKVAGSVEVSEPETMKGGARVVRVGTKVFYARFWEFGHINRYSRLFERVPVWRPVAVQQAQNLAAQMLTSYGSMMSVWKPRVGGAPTTSRGRRRA